MDFCKYYYELLSVNNRKLCSLIIEQIKSFNHVITLNTDLSSSEIAYLFRVIDLDYPELFYFDIKSRPLEIVSCGQSKSIKVNYSYTPDQVTIYQKRIDNKLSPLKKYLIGKSILEKESIIHNSLFKNVRYENKDNIELHNIIGPFLQGKAVCEGFSKAFKYLCEFNDIPCMIVTGNGSNVLDGSLESHAWNIVKIENNYCHVDSTWNSLYYSIKTSPFPYYNVSDEFMKIDHTWDYSCTPVCKGMPKKEIPIFKSIKDLSYYIYERLSQQQGIIIFDLDASFPSKNNIPNTVYEIVNRQPKFHAKSVKVSYNTARNRTICEVEYY